jgi:hypothetical protein
LSRPTGSFLVSGTQEAGNWETGADSLIPEELLFPKHSRKNRASRKQKSDARNEVSAHQNSFHAAAPPMAIQRQYRPAAGTLTELVEALYSLLAENTDQLQSGSVTASPEGIANGSSRS